MSQNTILELQVNPSRSRKIRLFWDCLLALLLTGGALLALSAPWGSLAPEALLPGSAAAAALALCLLSEFSRRGWLRLGLRLLPLGALAALLNPMTIWQGLLLWFNCVLSRWNQLHQDGLSLFSVEATAASVTAVSVLLAYALGLLGYWLVSRKRLPLCGVLGAILLLLQLLLSTLSPLSCALYMSAFLGLWMGRTSAAPTRRAVCFWGLCTVVLGVFALALPQSELSGITQLRQSAAEQVHTLRYGRDLLPQGNLSQAGQLNQGTTELLTVQTGQEKSAYLRGFVGDCYENGSWSPLPNSAYTGSYDGLLEWLKEQGFDPLTQSADYYALCDTETAPEENRLLINITGGSRYYLYVPASTSGLSMVQPKERKDTRFIPSGLFGSNVYSVTERYPTRPAELTIRASWVQSPRTDAQRQYVQAEALYRDFVYQNETAVDEALRPLLQQLFWEDADLQDDSVYSAISRIRSVLRTHTYYTRSPQPTASDTEPIRAFLTGQASGNAVLYASAAVQALRCNGIPARYVEGYYLSADAAAQSGTAPVALTGQNAHAWVEVYFDGIGWLPVDVTPGYYYDSVVLQQMIALPDTVRKTAAFEDSSDGANEVSQPAGDSHRLPEPQVLVMDAALLLLGAAALILLLAAALLLLAELLRIALELRAKRSFRNASPQQRVLLLRDRLFALLSLYGFSAHLGVHTQETDDALSQRFPDVEPGEYLRVVSLLEKSIYGGIALEPFELRVLDSMIEKLTTAERPSFQRMYWRIRYSRLHALKASIRARLRKNRAPRKRRRTPA